MNNRFEKSGSEFPVLKNWFRKLRFGILGSENPVIKIRYQKTGSKKSASTTPKHKATNPIDSGVEIEQSKYFKAAHKYHCRWCYEDGCQHGPCLRGARTMGLRNGIWSCITHTYDGM